MSSILTVGSVYSDVGYDDKRVSLIRRIDFAWAVEKDTKKQKKASKEETTQWPWQSLVENLRLAHQELSVIIDLISTVRYCYSNLRLLFRYVFWLSL